MDREQTLCLCFRLEMPHLAFSLLGVLVGQLGLVAFVQPGWMGSR